MYSEFQETTTSQKSNNSCGWGRRREKLFVFPLYQASIVQQQLTKVVSGLGEGEGYLFFFNIKHQ